MGMDDMGMDSEMGDDSMEMGSDDEESEDNMDLEAIIRELEAQLGDDDQEEVPNEEGSMYENLADGFTITDLGTPTNNTDAATKAYVDTVAGSATAAAASAFCVKVDIKIQ